jgi:hypothetical protein
MSCCSPTVIKGGTRRCGCSPILTTASVRGLLCGTTTPTGCFLAKRLFQQYVVDAIACVDQNRLAWIRNNQNKTRADLYQGLADNLAASDISPPNPETNAETPAPGRRIVFPSSHVSSERFMRRPITMPWHLPATIGSRMSLSP